MRKHVSFGLRPNGALTSIIAVWVACTFISSLAGSTFVRAASDCLAPALLAQAATAALHVARRSVLRRKADAAPHVQPGHRAWVLALGLLHLMASMLTLASFGLSSISYTYTIRTLEPLCSCVLLYVLHQRRCRPSELLLLALVVGGTCCVVGPAPQHSTAGAGPEGSKRGSDIPLGRHTAFAAGGTLVPPAATLAFVATAVVSCRSVASKTVAALTDTAELDNFLESATPGLVAGAVLQVGLWAMFGLVPLQALWRSAGSPGNVIGALVVCALSQCAYNAASFKVLQHCTPVLHGVLNVIKRVAIIVVCALLGGRPLTPLQLLGVLAANAAAAALAVQQSAAAAGCVAPGTPGSARLGPRHVTLPAGTAPAPPAAAAAAAAEKAGQPRACGSSWSGGSAATERLLGRLVYVIASVIICGAVCTAYVVAALSVASQPPAAAGATASWPLLTRAGHDSSSSSSAAGSSVHGARVLLPSGPDIGMAAARSAQLFALRDAQRAKCLADLHDVSKASLAPLMGTNVSAGSVALFDVALHKNLGDAVLWAAAARLVPEFHRSVAYVCALSQFPGRGAEARKRFPACNVKHMQRAVGPGGVVLLAPGGNWGDLWWFVHSQRLQYLRGMTAAAAQGPPFKVVQLPQSITFSSPDKMKLDRDTVNAMPAGMLTLFARQEASLRYARQHYANATVLQGPDLAFSLGPLMGGNEPAVDVLLLMRQDKEASGSETAAVKALRAQHAQDRSSSNGSSSSSSSSGGGGGGGGGTGGGTGGATSTADGGDGDGSGTAAAAALRELTAAGLSYEMREWEFAHENYTREVSRVALVQLAESRLQGAVDIISRGKVVVTNRLHAAIVANLVGRPLIWIDTQQHKLSGVRALAFSYSPACTEANLHSQQVGSFTEAVATAVDWLSRPDFVWSIRQAAPPTSVP